MLRVDAYEVLQVFKAPTKSGRAGTGVLFSNDIPAITLDSGDHLIISSSDFDELTVYAKKIKGPHLVPTILTEDFVQKNEKLFKKVI